MLTPLRRRLAVLALVLLVPTIGACAYQTDQVYQPGVGVNNRSGTVDVLGSVVVSGTDGSGTFIASLVNKDLAKTATLVAVKGADGLTVQLVAPVEVKPDSLVNMADLGAVSLSGESVKAGNFVRLVLTFDTGQETSLNVPVVDRNGEFSGVRPAIPSGSPTP